jgi:hypothetical protein
MHGLNEALKSIHYFWQLIDHGKYDGRPDGRIVSGGFHRFTIIEETEWKKWWWQYS